MKIALLLKSYPRTSETFIAQEILLLERAGFQFEIFSMRDPQNAKTHELNRQIKAPVTQIPQDVNGNLCQLATTNLAAARLEKLGYVRALLWALRKSLTRRSYRPLKRLLQAGWILGTRNRSLVRDVAHLHSHFIHAPAELGLLLSKMTGLSLSITAHAKDIYTSTDEDLLERIRQSQFVITCTRENQWLLTKLAEKGLANRNSPGAEASNKIHLVYHGVRLDAFCSSGRKKQARRIVTVARLADTKGYEDIIAALHLLKKQEVDFEYHVFGDGPLKQKLHQMSEGLDIVWHGAVAQAEVIAGLAASSLFILASRVVADGDRDGIPNSIAEAMSMELPVVATAVSGIPELVVDGQTGLLVGERNPEALAEAVRTLLHDEDLRDQMGQAARRRVARVFDAEHCIDGCVRLFAPYRGLPERGH